MQRQTPGAVSLPEAWINLAENVLAAVNMVNMVAAQGAE